MMNVLPHLGLNSWFDRSLRTEDVRFSPSGRVLAVVATRGMMFLFAVDTSSCPVRISRHTELRSSGLSTPHGVDFLSEDVLVVANRTGWLTFFRIPAVENWEDRMTVEPIHEMGSVWFGPKGAKRIVGERNVSCGPGSVRVHGDRLFVCCNNSSTVTAHPYTLRQGLVETGEGRVVARAGLEIPDGVAISRDGRWMAVSDHHHNRVVMYGNAEQEAPLQELRDADLRYPHGLCFDPSGSLLYVADAGERLAHVFASQNGWDRNVDRSVFKLPAIDVVAFNKTKEAAGDYKALEGGIKGIDVDPSGRVMATTCNNQILRFFELESVPAQVSLVAEQPEVAGAPGVSLRVYDGVPRA